ncbi:MAG: sodium:solute symporter [Phycisphaerae bacterium]
MLAAQSAVGPIEILLTVAYLLVVGYLGWLGYRRTSTDRDYLLAGRKTHPFIMAMSYAATFISTSAIVGFGGVAGMFGMSLLWLVMLNILVGIFIAFVFLGGRTRRVGHHLDAHTFPELLGRRYNSKFIQIFAGLIIFVGIPLYAAAVLIGGCTFIAAQFQVDYPYALIVFSILIAGYVVYGGLKGVMYTDALQGTIMLVAMIALIVVTYVNLGGVSQAHESLGQLSTEAPSLFKGIGFTGWTSFPEYGWGSPKYDLWWIVVSTITMGVGIGVLAQPQLSVRFMTVKSQRELNRAVILGGLFILLIPGSAYVVGSLSNLHFHEKEVITGRITHTEKAGVIAKRSRDVIKRIPCELMHIEQDDGRNVTIVARGFDVTTADGKTIPFSKIMPTAEVTELPDGRAKVRPRATSFTRAVVRKHGEYMFDTDSIIPFYITTAMPGWFGMLFLLTLLAAAMSTLSSQFHTLGTAIGRDVFEQVLGPRTRSIGVTRIGIIIGILLAVLISYYARGGYFIARATAIFFGVCASAFLPALIGGLFFRRVTRPAAAGSMVVGFAVTLFWLALVKAKEAEAIGLVQHVTGGKHSLLADWPNWPVVDPILVALPASTLTLIVISLLTTPAENKAVDECFRAKV